MGRADAAGTISRRSGAVPRARSLQRAGQLTAACCLAWLAAVAPSGGAAHAAAVHSHRSAEASEGLLSGSFVEAPLRSALDEIARSAGVRVQWLGRPTDELITVAFRNLPIEIALARVVSHRAHLVTLARDATGQRLARLWVGSPADGAPAAAREGEAAELGEPAGEAPSWQAELAALDGMLADPEEYVRLTAVQRLADLGEASPVVERLALVATRDGDAQVRTAALLALEQAGAPPVEALLAIARKDASRALQGKAARLLALAAVAGDPAAEAAIVQMTAVDRNPRLRAIVRDALAAIEEALA